MKVSFALSALASAMAVYAESVYFVAANDDKTIDFPISSIHEGAGINYFLGGAGGTGEVFDLQRGVASNKQGTFTAYVGIVSPYLASGPAVSPTTFRFRGDTIENYNFFACKDTNDPYNYSSKSWIITVNDKKNSTAPFKKCTGVSILKREAGNSTSVSPSSASTAAPTSWSNGTVITTKVTVTDYTTVCPGPTTVTVTVCTENVCKPRKYTVTEATTLTVTGECVVPTTYTKPHPVSTSKASSIPIPSSIEGGAAKVVAGVFGIAGIVALML